MKKAAVTLLRILGYVLMVIVFTMVVMALTQWFIGDWEAGGPRLELLGEGLLTALGVALTNLILYLATRSRELWRGWPALSVSLRGFVRGGGIGFAMAAAMLLLTVATGGIRIGLDRFALGPYLAYVLPLAGALLLAALAEEWFFRGVPLTMLASLLGRGWANLALGLLFAAAHFSSTGSNWLVAANIVLGSLVVGAMRFSSGGLPAAWGFHFAWNLTQVLVGASLSLEGLAVPGIRVTAIGSDAWSGGAFGPEAGIGATIATLATLAILTVIFRRRGERDLPIPFPR